MKSLRKFFAVTLLVLTLGFPAFADGQMEIPKPQNPPPMTQDGQMEIPFTVGGQTDISLALIDPVLEGALSVAQSILALI